MLTLHHARHAYIATLQALGWSKVAALTQDGQKYSDYMSSLQDQFQNNGIEFVMNRKFPKEATDMSMVSSLVNFHFNLTEFFSICKT